MMVVARAIAMEENIRREDLNPYEKAQAFRLFIERFGYTEDKDAKRYGKSRSFVANRLRLLNMDPYLIKCVLSKTLPPWQALMIDTALVKKYLLADFIIDWGLSFEESREAIKRINSGEEDIRITRSINPKGLRVLEPRYYECDSTYLEELMLKGKPPFTVSVWVGGVVRLGHLAVLVAKRLGWDRLEVEIVFPVDWSKGDISQVMLCDDFGSYDNDIFLPMTDAQRRASTKLRQLLKGHEEEYPLLVLDDTPSVPDDLTDLPIARPVLKPTGNNAR